MDSAERRKYLRSEIRLNLPDKKLRRISWSSGWRKKGKHKHGGNLNVVKYTYKIRLDERNTRPITQSKRKRWGRDTGEKITLQPSSFTTALPRYTG